jgi:ribosomal protein S18 acetylase RimI-like enzyme
MTTRAQGYYLPMSIQIRDARPDDAAFLAAGNIAMALEAEHKHLDPAVVAQGVRAALDDDTKGRYFVAVQGGRPLGQLMVTDEWSDWRNGRFWWIQSVYVLPKARRQGVFRALYRHVEQLAQSDPGVCGIRLYVERENLRAQATYRHCGLEDGGYIIMETDYSGAVRAAGENDNAV